MVNPNSDEGLPPGWTVEVRVRKNGKRDKYYFSPFDGLKFNSKVEVFRHLDNIQNKVSIERISDNVVVEKCIAEGLPAGWMKKTRITTKGDTIRKDPYYIDPVSGYVFRSIRDVDRYLETGYIGKNAFKPKDKGSGDMVSKDDKFCSGGVTAKPTLSISLGQSSGLDMIANDQQIPRPATSGVVGTELIGSVLSQAESSDEKEGKVGLAESALVLACTDEDAQVKQLQENPETKQNRERKYKHKKEIDLPRRASKRLAGIKVDQVPELQTRSRARRVEVKQSGEEEIIIINADKSPNSMPNTLAKQFNALGGSETKCKSDAKDQECFSFSSLENHATKKECLRVVQNGDTVDAKLDYNTLDFPLKEILTDPCIAFAIQTLTGVTFETSKDSQISPEEHSGKKIDVPGNVSKRRNVLPSPEHFAIPQEHAGNENAGSSSSGKTWMDPCIEFAVKTLTGTGSTTTLPLDSDRNPKSCIQQKLSSSNNQQHHSEMALSSVNLGNLCHSDYYCSQYFGTQKPMFNQETNIGIGNSGGARLPHCGEDRRNAC